MSEADGSETGTEVHRAEREHTDQAPQDARRLHVRAKFTTKGAVVVIVLIVAVSSGVFAAMVVMKQTAPYVPDSALIQRCETLTASLLVVGNGSSGDLFYSCGSKEAFSNTAGTDVVATPAFTLPYKITDLFIYPSQFSLASSCANTTGAVSLSTGTSVSVGPGAWNYCADYDNNGPGGLDTFTITWSQ